MGLRATKSTSLAMGSGGGHGLRTSGFQQTLISCPKDFLGNFAVLGFDWLFQFGSLIFNL